MPSVIKLVRVASLRPHPMNKKIYRSEQDADLLASIAEHGILEPLVITEDFRVVSGHRRLSAARRLGLKRVPARSERFDDETLALIEFNRQRVKTWSERYRELQAILPRLQTEAARRRSEGARRGAARRHGLPETHLGHRHGRSRVYDEVAQLTGLSREKIRKLIRIHEAVGAGLAPASIAEQLDEGGITVHQAYLAVRKAQSDAAKRERLAEDTSSGQYDLDGMIQPFDVWAFPKRDRRFDVPADDGDLGSPGSPPPQVWVNLFHLLTSEGDLIVDPMAGTGTTGRVATWMKRRCLSFDIAPRGDGVRRHDLTSGFPPVPEPPGLIVLDPPYFDQRAYSRRRRDLSRSADIGEFLERLDRCVSVCLDALATDGHFALVMGNDSRTDSPDLCLAVADLLERRAPIRQRIAVPYSHGHHPPYRVAAAVSSRTLLTLRREIFITSNP